MNKRIVVNLEQEEYSALLNMAIFDLRNPADELRYILRVEIERRNQESNIKNETDKVYLLGKEEVLA